MKKIAWEKWEDKKFYLEMNKKEEDQEEGSEFEEKFDMFQIPEMPINVRTPLGIYNIADPMLPSRMFDCWLGYTNFDITKKELQIMNKVPGIEALRVISRYRFFVGVAKLFEFRDVRRDLNYRLCGVSSKEDDEDLSVIEKMSKIEAKKWAVFIPNSGEMEKVVSNQEYDADFDLKLEALLKRKDGKLITSPNMVYNKDGLD